MALGDPQLTIAFMAGSHRYMHGPLSALVVKIGPNKSGSDHSTILTLELDPLKGTGDVQHRTRYCGATCEYI